MALFFCIPQIYIANIVMWCIDKFDVVWTSWVCFCHCSKLTLGNFQPQTGHCLFKCECCLVSHSFFLLSIHSFIHPFSHGNKEVFSCLGIQLAVNFFLERGHTAITVFVPSWRKEQPRPDVPITGKKTGIHILLISPTYFSAWGFRSHTGLIVNCCEV